MTFDWRRLPDPVHLARLERVAADYFGVGSRHVCAVPGSEIGLRLVGTLIGGAARHVVPGYRTHGEMIPESAPTGWDEARDAGGNLRSEEHTSELQSLMRISYAVFCLKKKKKQPRHSRHT